MLYSFLLYSDFAPLIIRLALGLAFVVHGYPKLFKKENREQFPLWLDSMGIKPGKFWALVVGVVEFFGGIALILGIWVQLAAFLVAIDMFVAMWKAKWGKVGFATPGGWELDFVYLAMALSLLLTGAGAWSLGWYSPGY